MSAMGNDGPAWGTLNAPGDAVEVIGVGASKPILGKSRPSRLEGFRSVTKFRG